MRPRLRRLALRPVLLLLPVVVVTGCGPTGDGFAERGCEETAALLQMQERGQEVTEKRLADATAWADRAADVDRAFDDLRDDLTEVRDAVRAEDGLGAAAETSADEAFVRVAERCAELGTPVESGGLSASEIGVGGLVTR